MKTILKYLSAGRYFDKPPVKNACYLYFRFNKIMAAAILILFATQNALGQRNVSNLQPDGMLIMNIGVDDFSISRQAFDKWTRMNFNRVENNNPNIFADFGCIFRAYDIGVSLSSNGVGFDLTQGYIGRRLTRPQSPVSSWLNLEFGGISGQFTNIRPVNYVLTPDQVGQKLQLRYASNYWGLTSKNYLNFLHYNAPSLKHKKISINSGFFVSVDYQPYSRQWHYGYYNQDTIFTAVRIKTIPLLGKIHGTAGVFCGF
jgi:hypothetical protein